MPKGKLLLVTYYWPPCGGVAVLRWLYMVYYLNQLGWDITVLIPKHAHFPQLDPDLQSIIPDSIHTIEVPITEPASLYSKLTKQQANGTAIFQDKSSWLKRSALFIRANVFIPDARMLWINSIVKAATQLLKQVPYDILLSNGTPHSCHVAAHRIHKIFPNIPWIADFRDPWLEIDYFKELPLTKRSLEKHKKLEHEVVTSCTALTTVSPSWVNLFEQKGAKQVQLVTNGYTTSDFEHLQQNNCPNAVFTIKHIGLMDRDRNPKQLWQAIQHNTGAQVKIICVGAVSQQIVEQTNELENVEFTKPVSHSEAIEEMTTADALLLLNNQNGNVRGRIPAKVFEYLATKKPIIYIGTFDNDALRLLQKTIPDRLFAFEYSDEINLVQLIEDIRAIDLQAPIQTNQYSREHIAEQYSNFLSEFIVKI